MGLIDLTFNNSTSNKKFGKNFFCAILEKAAGKTFLKSKNFELSINLVGEAKIKHLNRRYRNKNKVTDVLSFPLDADLSVLNGIISLGDIIICLPFVEKRAKMERADIKKEITWTVVHGFLHLLGYDHEKSRGQRLKMEELENAILNFE